MDNKICKELNGIKVGDKVEYEKSGETHKGYVAVIDKDDTNIIYYILRLEGYSGCNQEEYWNESWYPESEKKNTDNCEWCRKGDFKVIKEEKATEESLKEENLFLRDVIKYLIEKD